MNFLIILFMNFLIILFFSFDFFNGKTVNFRQKKRYALSKETASVIKIVTENGKRYDTVRTVQYGTVRYGIADSEGHSPFLL